MSSERQPSDSVDTALPHIEIVMPNQRISVGSHVLLTFILAFTQRGVLEYLEPELSLLRSEARDFWEENAEDVFADIDPIGALGAAGTTLEPGVSALLGRTVVHCRHLLTVDSSFAAIPANMPEIVDELEDLGLLLGRSARLRRHVRIEMRLSERLF